MAKAKAWKMGAAGEPAYPDDFEIVRRSVLQVTDVKNNNNKYYGIELHKTAAKAAHPFRVFTHYGRTDDLETNPNAGAKESRYFDRADEALACYEQIFREKTGPAKGYKEVSLASSKIGSHKARGQSSGNIDARTLEKIEGEKEKRAQVPTSTLPAGIQSLVTYIYDEATTALTSTVAAKITANGIETPLGVLTIGQIERGEQILSQAYNVFQAKGATNGRADLERLSSDFYTAIPHRVGRTRDAIASAVLDSVEDFAAKQETLQLMKDMLKVNGEGGSVLYDAEIDAKYQALHCAVGWVEPGTGPWREIAEFVEKSQVKIKSVKVKNVFTLKRAGEHEAFAASVGNEKMLFHGSRIKNWVGILSRGILLPKIVVSMGVKRTDAGWLGNGIYFGDAACTSSFYTSAGKKGTRFMSIARVAMGRVAQFKKITYGMNAPPDGYDSCHGVRAKPGEHSEFADDEYVVYRTEQQRMEYLVEFTA